MPEEWLIDGYNLLHDVSRTTSTSIPERDRVFSQIACFAGPERSVLMVMDGVGDDEAYRGFRTSSFGIVHSQKVSADAYIEKRLCDRKGRAMLVVVTRDVAISRMARGSGARVFSPREFMELVGADACERRDETHRHRVRGHGFNRPFGDKL